MSIARYRQLMSSKFTVQRDDVREFVAMKHSRGLAINADCCSLHLLRGIAPVTRTTEHEEH